MGADYTFDIYLENDVLLGGLSLGFHIWSPDWIGFAWRDVGGLDPIGCLTVEPCSRMSHPHEVWDLGGLQIQMQDMDGTLPDTILFGGAALAGGLEPGPMEHLVSLHFVTSGILGSEVKTVCIDSTLVGSSGAFVFMNATGGAFAPTVAWEEGGRCYPVNIGCAPARLDDYVTNDTSCAPLETIYIENAATFIDIVGENVFIEYDDICNGTGDVTVIDNGDGTCDIGYVPVIQDAGKCVRIDVAAHTSYCWYPTKTFSLVINVEPTLPGDINFDGDVNIGDAVFLINHIFNGGAAPIDISCSDVNQDCSVNIGDGVYLINFIFNGGPPPSCSDCAY